jgi:hypothetical protein
MGEFFEQMPGENATAGKLRALSHHVEDRTCSFVADYGCVVEINHQAAAFQGVTGVAPGFSQLINPWTYQGSFNDQASFTLRING